MHQSRELLHEPPLLFTLIHLPPPIKHSNRIRTCRRCGHPNSRGSFTNPFKRFCRWLRMTGMSVPPSTCPAISTIVRLTSNNVKGLTSTRPTPVVLRNSPPSCGNASQHSPSGTGSPSMQHHMLTNHVTTRPSQSRARLKQKTV